MRNTFGNALSITLFGESHGSAIGAVLDGLAPGIEIDDAFIKNRLFQRKPKAGTGTARRESDDYRFQSGVYNGKTTGTPLCITIENAQQHSSDYETLRYTPRPGHADFAAESKYHGFQDVRGGGHFSGRLTAAIVAAGALVEAALRQHGIYIYTHIARMGGITDDALCEQNRHVLDTAEFPTISRTAETAMKEYIAAAGKEGDSVGGVLESEIVGLPAGIGEPWFDSLEGVLSHVLFSIGGVKGVEFGEGFAIADMRGSEANDPYYYKDGRVLTATNHNGGIGGGITNGMPVRFRCAVKPTPSIYKKQKTVDLSIGADTELTISGRHDPAIVHRAAPVVNACAAIAVADLLTVRYGTDFLKTGLR